MLRERLRVRVVLLCEMKLIELSRVSPPELPPRPERRRPAPIVTLVLLLALSVFTYLNFQTVVVEGRSMEPNFHSGERLLVTRAFWLFGEPNRDDVVVIRDNEGPHAGFLIKRVVALPGDWVPGSLAPGRMPMMVPPGHVFVLGDNLAESDDSRRFGPVPVVRILGKVVR